MLTLKYKEGVVLWCFFFNDTATTEIYTLSLHDALPICPNKDEVAVLTFTGETTLEQGLTGSASRARRAIERVEDRKSTRLNSSHANISYAVFCLKKKKETSSSWLNLPTTTGRRSISRTL